MALEQYMLNNKDFILVYVYIRAIASNLIQNQMSANQSRAR